MRTAEGQHWNPAGTRNPEQAGPQLSLFEAGDG
jgi:hypothetical protein